MHYDKNDSLLTAAFEVVKHYDPATYARMVESDWNVSEDVRKASPEYWGAIVQDPNAMTSFGVTISDNGPAVPVSPETFIVPWMVGAMTEENKIAPELFVADVLVHEFAHIHSFENNEMEASKAGAAFARLLPGEDGMLITQVADEHAEEIEES